jgi:alpha-ketoglutaric semialdehyde dehydrogenase
MKPALLLVDLQRDYLADPALTPAADTLVDHAAAWLEACRGRRFPIVHIWTTVRREVDRRLPHWRAAGHWICVDNTPGHRPPDTLRPVAGEQISQKSGFNPFRRGHLEWVLTECGCDTVWIAGVHLHTCVRTTAMECLERDLQVWILEDAVGSNDPILAVATRRWLQDRGVRFQPGSSPPKMLPEAAPSALVHRSPRNSADILFEVPVSDTRWIAAAAGNAHSAWKRWRSRPMAVRCELLERLACGLERAREVLALQLAVEIGKPLPQGIEEIDRAVANIRDVATRASAFPLVRSESAGHIRDAPLGVVAIVTAWNNPLAIPLGKIAPALAYGNTVVWKPAPAGTGVARVVLSHLAEAGFPPETVQLVTGDDLVARRLAASADVAAVTLTGSTTTGHSLREICARRWLPFQAELSGNNAAIVWSDADLKVAAAKIAWGAFAFAGQRCTANRRVIVPTSLSDRFLAELEFAAQDLVWGDPLEPDTEIGPLITCAKRDEMERAIARAQTGDGALRVLRTHGDIGRSDWTSRGAYARTAIIACDRADAPIVQEESMAPILVLQPAQDFEHALALCDGVQQGLIASLFTDSDELQRRFLAEARAGVLKINVSTAGVDVSLPFGGWKASGTGPPEHGEGDRLFYTRPQAIHGAGDLP